MKMLRQTKEERRIASGAGILLVGSVVAKMLGALYRIPLTNVLGAEGMGMYQLVFPVYALFMVLATAGIPTALSRIVAEKRALGEDSKKYFAVAMTALLSLGLIFGALIASLSRFLAQKQGNADTYQGFLAISPAIVCVCVISGFRGLFQGQMYMLPTALSNVIEQVVKLSVGLALAYALSKRGIVAAVCGALLGVTASEVVTVLYMLFTYLFRTKKDKKTAYISTIAAEKATENPVDFCAQNQEKVVEKGRIECEKSGKKAAKNAVFLQENMQKTLSKSVRKTVSKAEVFCMLRIALPIAAVAVLMPLSSFFDSVIIVNMLKLFGLEKSVATAQYGIISGPVNSLVNMPVVAIMSLAVAIVPSVSASRVTHDIDGVMLKSSLCVRLAYLLGVPFAFFLAVFAPRIIGAIYPSLSPQNAIVATNVLRITSANVVFLSVMQIYISLLQALDKTKYAVLSLVCAIIVKIALDVLLTKRMGVNGAAIASLALPVAAYLGTMTAYFKICGLRLEKNVGLNLLSGVIMALCGIAVTSFFQNDMLAIAVGFLVCFAVYVWLAFFFNLVSKDDIPHLPLKKLLWALHRTIRFWEYKDETR